MSENNHNNLASISGADIDNLLQSYVKEAIGEFAEHKLYQLEFSERATTETLEISSMIYHHYSVFNTKEHIDDVTHSRNINHPYANISAQKIKNCIRNYLHSLLDDVQIDIDMYKLIRVEGPAQEAIRFKVICKYINTCSTSTTHDDLMAAGW